MPATLPQQMSDSRACGCCVRFPALADVGTTGARRGFANAAGPRISGRCRRRGSGKPTPRHHPYQTAEVLQTAPNVTVKGLLPSTLINGPNKDRVRRASMRAAAQDILAEPREFVVTN